MAITLNDVPIDVLAERLNTTRSALYKTLHDARRRLRAALAERGMVTMGRLPRWSRWGDLGRELERMIGPACPEFDCDECFDQLDVYVELGLTGIRADVAMPAMHAHLAGCPACCDDHESLLAFTRADPSGV